MFGFWERCLVVAVPRVRGLAGVVSGQCLAVGSGVTGT